MIPATNRYQPVSMCSPRPWLFGRVQKRFEPQRSATKIPSNGKIIQLPKRLDFSSAYGCAGLCAASLGAS